MTHCNVELGVILTVGTMWEITPHKSNSVIRLCNPTTALEYWGIKSSG
jgi:hypothetical protein